MNERIKYNQFVAMGAIFRASFRAMLRNPSSIAFGIVFPLIFILAFGFIGSSVFRIEVAYSKPDNGNAFITALGKNHGIMLKEYDNKKEAEYDLSRGKIDAYIETEPRDNGFGVSVLTTSAAPDKGKFF